MLPLVITLLTSLAVSSATNTVQVTVVNDRTKYNGDIWNTTVDVPFPGKSAELSLPNAVLLSISGGRGIDVHGTICTPTWLTSAGEVLGASFELGEVSRTVKGSIGLHVIKCVPLDSALQRRAPGDVCTRDWPVEDTGLHGPPDVECLWKASTAVGDPYPCECFTNGMIKSDNFARDAVEMACTYFRSGTVGFSTDWKHWHHYPPNDEDEGVLLLRVAWHGQDTEYCDYMIQHLDELNLQFGEKCFDSFWGLFINVDETDKSDPSDNKYGCGQNRGGGWGTDSCLVWEFDANPSRNNPELKIGCTNDPESEGGCRVDQG